MGIELVGVDPVGVDPVGVDLVGVDLVGGHQKAEAAFYHTLFKIN